MIPSLCKVGIAISDLHVVGLQDPPRNTSYAILSVVEMNGMKTRHANLHICKIVHI